VKVQEIIKRRAWDALVPLWPLANLELNRSKKIGALREPTTQLADDSNKSEK
jgi:hypothetical protein